MTNINLFLNQFWKLRVENINRKSVFIITGIAWSDAIQRQQRLAIYLANRGWQVFFFERVPSSCFGWAKIIQRIWLLLRRSSKRPGESGQNIPLGVTLISFPFIWPSPWVFNVFNLFLVILLKLRFRRCDAIITYLPIPLSVYFNILFHPSTLIYDCCRVFSKWPHYPATVRKQELALIDAADEVFCDSYFIKEVHLSFAAKRVTQVLPTVADNKAFKTSVKPGKIKRLVYFGSVDLHVNLKTLVFLADLGLEIHVFGKLYVDLPRHSKIRFMGYVESEQNLLESICRNGDAIIIPYQGDMDGVLPAKFCQSLATGLPVFISSFYDSERLSDFVYVFRDDEALVNLISCFDFKEFLAKQDKIRQFVESCSDEAQFIKFANVLDHRSLQLEE